MARVQLGDIERMLSDGYEAVIEIYIPVMFTRLLHYNLICECFIASLPRIYLS